MSYAERTKVPYDHEYDEFDDSDQDDGLNECGNPLFECAGYYPEPAGEFYCPLWGTEECDWECPRR